MQEAHVITGTDSSKSYTDDANEPVLILDDCDDIFILCPDVRCFASVCVLMVDAEAINERGREQDKHTAKTCSNPTFCPLVCFTLDPNTIAYFNCFDMS
jgi:hypothetical protein